MLNNEHIHIFQLPEDHAGSYDEIQEKIFDEFYSPSARQILIRWINELEKFLNNDAQYKKIYTFLDRDMDVLQEIIWHIALYIAVNTKIKSLNNYCYVIFIEPPSFKNEILSTVKSIMTEYGL